MKENGKKERKRERSMCVCLYASYISTLCKIAAAQQPPKRISQIIEISRCRNRSTQLSPSFQVPCTFTVNQFITIY